jgi:dipeptidyl aminopeptidase/acylaminoacyl peptidase
MPKHQKQAEFGTPQWVLGLSTYAFLSETQLVCTYTKQGLWYLATIQLENFEFQTLPIQLEESFGEVTDIEYVQAFQGQVVFVASGPKLPKTVLMLDSVTGAVTRLSTPSLPAANIQQNLSSYQSITFPIGNDGQEVGHAFYYPPYNAEFDGPNSNDELPPLLMKMHGGPTAATSTRLNLGIHYFTSRGFGVVDINYRGSTGFGRAYRLALYQQWGIYDRDDCISVAKYLANQKQIDIQRVVARRYQCRWLFGIGFSDLHRFAEGRCQYRRHF